MICLSFWLKDLLENNYRQSEIVKEDKKRNVTQRFRGM